MNRDESLPPAYVILRDYLIQNFRGKRASGGKECIIRCPFCGDSRDPRNAHLYVGPNTKAHGAISYNCFKCNTGGIVGTQFFRILGIYDTNITSAVLQYNQACGANINASARTIGRNFYSVIEKESVIPVVNSLEYQKKLDYINRRIGGSLTLADLPEFNIVLNLRDFLRANGITTYSRHDAIIEQLSFGFIGFVSVDSTHVTLRRIVPEDKVHESIRKRYTNYTINEKGTQIYCIKEGIDTTRPNMICIAEGAFDALGIHNSLLPYTTNKVVFASCGKDIETVLNYIIFRKRLDLFNTTFHIYIDNDISPYDLIRYRQVFMNLGLPFFIHRNGYQNEKDFGVPGDHIIDTLVR